MIDLEAIAWAYNKLQAFGVANSSMDNAMMMDRLNLMLLTAQPKQVRNPKYPWTPAYDWDKCPACFENFDFSHQCSNCGSGFDDQYLPGGDR